MPAVDVLHLVVVVLLAWPASPARRRSSCCASYCLRGFSEYQKSTWRSFFIARMAPIRSGEPKKNRQSIAALTRQKQAKPGESRNSVPVTENFRGQNSAFRGQTKRYVTTT